LPKGKHGFRFDGARFLLDVTGSHMLRLGQGAYDRTIVEVLPDVDAEIKTEFPKMIDVPPI
jgi:hypothetical protein